MAIQIRPAKWVKKAKSKNSQEVLERLKNFLESSMVTGEPVQILCGFWEDQQNAISYQELRQVVIEGEIGQELLTLWSQDYSTLVGNKLSHMWQEAITIGATSQTILDSFSFKLVQNSGITNWIKQHGAEFVTICTEEQKQAIAALLTKKIRDHYTVDELSRLIRPCIGLTKGQAKANIQYYNNIVATLKKDHPRMKRESIQKKAREAAAKYAERQHRERAMMIAQTESAFAYNRGADEGVRQAQEQGLLGVVKKRWSTSGDDGVCSICSSLDGVEVDMDKEFDFKGKILFRGHHMLPPAHPRCACAVEYIEESISAYPKESVPEIKVSITQKDSLKEYTTEEIESIATQTEEIVSKHISIPSKWIGKVKIIYKGISNSDGTVVYYGKLWDCDILTKHETAPAIILHEQIHARSISYYDSSFYDIYKHIEEASVQFMTQEICKIEGIEIIPSYYDEKSDILRIINRRINVCNNTYDFAKKLIEMPVTKRLDWLSNEMYDILSRDETATLEEYQELAEMLNTLY